MEASTSSCNGGGGRSELFICFTSRLPSMKKLSSSKSLLSPGRSSQISLSSSLSRRLRGAGQASPMFPAGKKRSGAAAFENPEPSSPKVTCIGQVRVKSKAKKNRTNKNPGVARCRRSLSSGEASFRRSERERNGGRWVTICDALRLNCLVPSCGGRKKKTEEGGSWCGAVLARWREIELVVASGRDESPPEKEGKKEEEEEAATSVVVERSGSVKRRVFEGIEFRELDDDDGGGGGVEKARVSLCVPPKNALLLMRCRSDPVKMAALASRFWPGTDQEDEDDDDDDDNVEDEEEEEEEEEDEPELVDVNNVVAVVEEEEEDEKENEIDKVEEEEEEGEREVNSDEANVVEKQDSESEEENMFRLLYEEEEEEEEEEMKRNWSSEESEREREKLPECLVLMMCEPKLSMEVSKETWVCTTDFVRCLPDRRRPAPKKPPTKPLLPPNPVPLHPPRSSCSTALDRTLAANPYEPFLTRCKSEPMRSAAALAAAPPETCFWKSTKLEPRHHRPAAGVGV